MLTLILAKSLTVLSLVDKRGRICIHFRLSAKYPCGKGAGVVSLIGKDEQVFDTQYITIQVQSLTQFHSFGFFITIMEKCNEEVVLKHAINFFVRFFYLTGSWVLAQHT